MSKEDQLTRDVIKSKVKEAKKLQAFVVDIYCRVSTDDQEDNTSLEGQEAEARIYCKKNDWIVGEVHKEVFSGYKYRERKKLEVIRQRYRDGKIQGVVIRTLDRLSRSQSHIAILMEEMEHYNVTLYSIKEVIDETPMGKFARMVLAFVAEMEREKIMDRTNTGRINKALVGKVPTGKKPPYGWKWTYTDKGERDYIVLDEKQAAVLQRGGTEYADGDSMDCIVGRFNAEGIIGPGGGRWYPSPLFRLITDPRMTGKGAKIFDRTNKRAKSHLGVINLPDGTYPQILSEELHARILVRTTMNAAAATRRSSVPEQFLLRAGFARCKYCGNALQGYVHRKKKGNLYYYQCCTKGAECYHHTAQAVTLDAEVWALVSLAADHQHLIERSINLASKKDLVAMDLNAVDRSIATWRGKIKNYESDLDDPSLRGDTRASIRQLLNAAYEMVEKFETEQAKIITHSVDIEKQKAAYNNLLEWCKKTKDMREELTYLQKRDFLQLLGITVFVGSRPDRYHPLDWDAKLGLPELDAILHEAAKSELCNSASSRSAPLAQATPSRVTRQAEPPPTSIGSPSAKSVAGTTRTPVP